ncbi:hypothetical protein [Paracoccus pacificus]|uniref:Uncharacterized protein n=1 Tax=Paracoccus pacificus TaxID=1463598 RepID=A0ABW4R245_9RHOB
MIRQALHIPLFCRGVLCAAAMLQLPAAAALAQDAAALTPAEKAAFVAAVGACWTQGALPADAAATVVTIALRLNPDGTPDSGSIRMLKAEGGTEASVEQAYTAARRAILRCSRDGYTLPKEKYDVWKDVVITFTPDEMRMR